MRTDPGPATAPGGVLLTVAAVDRLTADAVAVTFDLPDEHRRAFAFRAGQHLVLRRVVDGVELRRTYSLCSSAAGGPLRIAVRRLDGGAFSSWLVDELRPGDAVEVLPPTGRFGPEVDPGRARRYGLVAGGSGITPVLSIAATVLDLEPASEVVLLCANRTAADVMLLEELADLKDRHPARLQVLHVLSREEQESELLSGRLDPERLRRVLAALVPPSEVDEWYLCGPYGLVTDGRRTLLDAGVAPDLVHVELFHAEPLPPRVRTPGPPTGAATVTVRLHGRSTTLAVERDGETVLDRVLALRPDAPYACRGGVCGTCRARVLDGEVEMDVHHALEPDELAAGVVLTCQARPVTDVVRLEYL